MSSRTLEQLDHRGSHHRGGERLQPRVEFHAAKQRIGEAPLKFVDGLVTKFWIDRGERDQSIGMSPRAGSKRVVVFAAVAIEALESEDACGFDLEAIQAAKEFGL